MCVCVLKRSKNNDPLSDDGDEMGNGLKEVVFRGWEGDGVWLLQELGGRSWGSRCVSLSCF